MRTRLQGIFAPIPTCFTASGEVDHAAVGDNVRVWAGTDLAGLLALGSNGEAALLDEEESAAVIATVRDALPRGALLLAGTGRESTRGAIAAAKRAAACGADAVLVRTPSFFKSQMTADALVAHFTAVADAAPVPVLLYNLPAVTGVMLTLPVVARLAEHPNIVGIKETSPDLERLGQFAQVEPARFAVLSGWAPVVFPALVSGAAGAILAVANVVPDLCVDLYRHVQAGRLDEALALQRRITPLAQLVTTGHSIGGLKVALDLVGLRGGPVRPPLRPPADRVRDEIARALADLGRSVPVVEPRTS
ncbi:MAG: dihydrodipicolinate synthase family protein [Vicinamibacterales bacterium]